MDSIEKIRDKDDSIFRVVEEIMPAAYGLPEIERYKSTGRYS
jgi:hypothetical protein